jgi:DNA-binding GntR family transcriptional regulator
MSEPLHLSVVSRRSRDSTPMKVYAQLRDAIARAELAPGRQLSENELAAALGVSRTPVREALAKLRDDRLVEVVPQLGTFVSRISAVAVADAQFIREALECAAVVKAAELCTEDDLRALEENLGAQERAVAARDQDAFYVLDDQFHQTLCTLSRHPSIWPISQRVKGHLNRVRRLSLPIPNYLGSMVEEHRAIVGAVGRRDPGEAELALRYHLRQVLREIPAIRAEHPEFFEDV